MSTQEVFVDQFAKLLRRYHEALSPEPEQPAVSRKNVSSGECQRLVAAARLAILELETNAKMGEDARRYFAKPGEAEWGC